MNTTGFDPIPKNGNVRTGTATPTGAATTVFNIPHGLAAAPRWAAVTPGNALSAALFSVTWDATNLIVTFAVGLTGALSLQWIAVS